MLQERKKQWKITPVREEKRLDLNRLEPPSTENKEP